METLLIIILFAAVVMLLSRAPGQAPQPQLVYLQATLPPEESTGGSGCLFWIVGGFIALVVLGIIPV